MQSPSEAALALAKVTREEIVQAARQVALDTVYFLKGTVKEPDGSALQASAGAGEEAVQQEFRKKSPASQRLGENYQKIHHPSGLTLLLCPMSQFSSAFALFATEYGSVDSTFKRPEDPDYVTVPDGIAHFLEHKMFECEDGDAFAKYAKTGASANAFTSFDKTAYLFSCTDNFKESLEILLNFVTKPYFTPETVAKEQG